jgi:hypothetical protein
MGEISKKALNWTGLAARLCDWWNALIRQTVAGW